VPSVFFYISGHGFGHSSRQIEIINALGASAANDLHIVVRTSAPRWLFEASVRVPIEFIEGPVDTGVVQLDSLRLDERDTIRRAAAFHRALPEKAREEGALLRPAMRGSRSPTHPRSAARRPRAPGFLPSSVPISGGTGSYLTLVTSDQIRGTFTFSIDTGCRSACARNAGRSRSDLKPM
jgi:hypothetical protein